MGLKFEYDLFTDYGTQLGQKSEMFGPNEQMEKYDSAVSKNLVLDVILVHLVIMHPSFLERNVRLFYFLTIRFVEENTVSDLFTEFVMHCIS
jgi:hypothetical protein